MIRKVVRQDLEGLKAVLDTLSMFPSEMLDEMMADYFTNPTSQELWATKEQDGEILAIAYCAPEKLTEGTFNLYAIGVKSTTQTKGIGSELLSFIETELCKIGGRILIVDTSSLPEFEASRQFYLKQGFVEEARIRDFWTIGDDKVTFWKKL